MTCKVPGCPEPRHAIPARTYAQGEANGRMYLAAPARTHALVKLVAAVRQYMDGEDNIDDMRVALAEAEAALKRTAK